MIVHVMDGRLPHVASMANILAAQGRLCGFYGRRSSVLCKAVI